MTQATHIQLKLAAIAENAPYLTQSIQEILSREEALIDPENTLTDIQQSVETAFLAAVDASETIIPDFWAISLRLSKSSFIVTIDDIWEKRFPLARKTKAEATPTYPPAMGSGIGAGLFLMHELMDEVLYLPEAGRNYWYLRKELPMSIKDVDRPQALQEPIFIHVDMPGDHQYLSILSEVIALLLQNIPTLARKDETIYQIQLAVQEACTNIINHAYTHTKGRISATLTLVPDVGSLTIELRDTASNTFDLSAVPSPDFISPPKPTGSSGFLAGGALLMISTTIVNGGNYVFNLVLGRWLGPAAFADLSLIVTLMLMITLITATFQTVTAKFAAAHTAMGTLEHITSLRQWVGRLSWWMGGAALILLAFGAPVWADFFHMESVWPFVLLAVGLPMYFMQGVDRGILQGQTRFGWLSVSYQAEMWVRLISAVALVYVGLAVNGAVAALTLSFIATWWIARKAKDGLPQAQALTRDEKRAIAAFAAPVSVALIGQILINNSDILIVKRFFLPEEAGQYAALALIGRIVFFATWSIVTTLFPIVAQKQERGEAHRYLLFLSLGLVGIISAVIIAMTLFIPDFIVNILFGEAYLSIAPLLWLYAIATMLYALANAVINYHLSLGNGAGGALVILAGFSQVGGLWFFHNSLYQVVMIQIYIMSVLLVSLLAWDMWLYLKDRRGAEQTGQQTGGRVLSRV